MHFQHYLNAEYEIFRLKIGLNLKNNGNFKKHCKMK